MDEIVYKMSAFTMNNQGGNLAGVVLNADQLNETQMLNIAKDIGYSETAFVMKSKNADFKVRFFTPVDEVNLCGHATIAAFTLLRELKILKTGSYTQETKAGILKILIEEEAVFMEQNLPEFYECIDLVDIRECLDIDDHQYMTTLPVQIVSTGLRDIIIPIKNLECLLNMKANHEAIINLSTKYNVVGIHAFTLETMHNHQAHVRNFAPLFGINEESATGTANGALVSYFAKYDIDPTRTEFIIEQGYCMSCPSLIKVKIERKSNEITSIYVGGSGV